METAANLSISSTKRFTDFALAQDVIDALTRAGIEHPTPIQESCISPIIERRDVVGKAETGTGKTIGFAAPIVSRIDTNRVSVQSIVLTPTRELAQQVAGVFEELGQGRGLKVALLVGGVHASEQILRLRTGCQVAVGTPGRVLEFLQERILSLVWCDVVVLDEADRMLDMGFIDDVTAILDTTPDERQTLLFSATIPPEVKQLLHRYMKSPEVYSTSSGLATVPEIRQVYVEADFPQKFRALQGILDAHRDDSVIVFCNTRRQAIDLDRMLWGHGYSAGSLHGEHDQDVRFRVLEAFRTGDIKVLVATDVASRGLDVEDVGCVINYEIPDEPSVYVHRIGRTGRAQKKGLAISIVSGKEWGNWERILRETKFSVEREGPSRLSRRGGHRLKEDRRGRRSRDGGRRRGSWSAGGIPVAAGAPYKESGPREGETMANTEWAPDERDSSASGEVSQSGSPIDEMSPGAGQSGGGGPVGDESPGPEGRGSAGPGDDRQRSRRRRRRGRGRGQAPRDRQAGPSEEGPVAPDSRQGRAPPGRSEEGGDRVPRESAGHGAPRRGVAGGVEREDRIGSDRMTERSETEPAAPSIRDLPDRPKQERPPRKKLEDLDDDFVRTDYFSVDSSIIQRAEPPKPTSRGREAPPERHRQQTEGRGREGAERRHRGRGEPGARVSGSPPGGSDERGDGGRRRRRRRRRRGGGRPEGAQGGPRAPGGGGEEGGGD